MPADDKNAKSRLTEEQDKRNTYILIAMFLGSCTFMFLVLYNFPALTM